MRELLYPHGEGGGPSGSRVRGSLLNPACPAAREAKVATSLPKGEATPVRLAAPRLPRPQVPSGAVANNQASKSATIGVGHATARAVPDAGESSQNRSRELFKELSPPSRGCHHPPPANETAKIGVEKNNSKKEITPREGGEEGAGGKAKF